MYGIHLTVGHPNSPDERSYLVEEHRAPHEKLSQKAAEKLFSLVVDPVMDRLSQGTQLRNDTKEVFELLLQHFDRLPKDNSKFLELHQPYLSTHAPFYSRLDQIEQELARCLSRTGGSNESIHQSDDARCVFA